MRYAVIGSNNDGGRNATLHDTLDEAKQAVRDYLTDPENDPPITDEERANMERDLSYVEGEHVQSVRGSFAWKEWLYISPVDERERPPARPATMTLAECEAFAEAMIDAAGLDIESGLTATQMRRAYGRAIFQAQTGRPVLPE